MAPMKILLTGATGYIGGSILNTLIQTATGIVPQNSISILVRGEAKRAAFKDLPVTPILFNSLDETELLRKVASEHDIVINTASSQNTTAAKAFIQGLADRKAATGNTVHYFHTSGASCIGDLPVTGAYNESRVFSDKENIYPYLKIRESKQVYNQRTTDIAIIETGIALSVPSTLIMSPTIFGTGTGLFNTRSIQLPIIARTALKAGQVEVLGNGQGQWDYVHVKDLADLYAILVKRVLAGETVPSGEQGLLFSATGRFSWTEATQRVADALFQLGAIKTKEVKSVGIEDAAKWLGGSALTAELALASNAKTQSDVGKSFGWTPVYGEEAFNAHFLEDAKAILGGDNAPSRFETSASG